MAINGMRPVHPGEVLREDYLKPLGLSANALAKALHMPASRINDIVLERRGGQCRYRAAADVLLWGDIADAQGWVNLQATYDFKIAQKSVVKASAKQVKLREPMAAAAGR